MAVGISVVIPAYNAHDFMEQALECVCAQTYEKCEIIVIENGSTDDTFKIAESFKNTHEKCDIKVLRLSPNQGISGARNFGTQNASYEYVAYLDVDDIWYKDKLKRLSDSIEKHPEGDVFCHWERVVSEHSQSINEYKEVDNTAPYMDLLRHGNKLSTSATAVRKEMMLKIGGFDRKYVSGEEDYDCWMRLAEAGAIFISMPEVLGEYRLHGDNVSANFERHNQAVLNMVLEHIDSLRVSGKVSQRECLKLKKIIIARDCYAKGRHFSANLHDKKNAMKFFCESLKSNPCYIKTYAAIICALFGK